MLSPVLYLFVSSTGQVVGAAPIVDVDVVACVDSADLDFSSRFDAFFDFVDFVDFGCGCSSLLAAAAAAVGLLSLLLSVVGSFDVGDLCTEACSVGCVMSSAGCAAAAAAVAASVPSTTSTGSVLQFVRKCLIL